MPASSNAMGQRFGAAPSGHQAARQPAPEQRPQIDRAPARPPVAGAEQGGAGSEQGRAGIGVRVVEQQTAAVIAVALPRRPAAHVEGRSERIGHGADALPEFGAERASRGFAFDRRGQQQLEHEHVIAARELPVQTALEGLQPHLATERAGGLVAPTRGLREIGKGAAGRELARFLGDQVVVRRGAVAAQSGEILLMVMELAQKLGVVVEQGPDPGPTVQQTPHPDPGEQPDAELDSARPMDAREERVAAPPGPQLRRREVRVTRVGCEEKGGREDGQLVVPRRLPDVFDRADLLDVATVDVERVGGGGRAPAGPRVEEPVGIAPKVVAFAVEERRTGRQAPRRRSATAAPAPLRGARPPGRGRARPQTPGSRRAPTTGPARRSAAAARASAA